MRRFKFSLKISFIGLIFIILFLRLSYWQWTRHLEKKTYIETLDARLKEEVLPLSELIAVSRSTDWGKYIHRRVLVKGIFDYQHEILLRNRKHQGHPGVHILTPLKISNSDQVVLIDRGYLPLEYSKKELRNKFQRKGEHEVYGLVKETMPRRIFSPQDPETGPDKPRVDSFS